LELIWNPSEDWELKIVELFGLIELNEPAGLFESRLGLWFIHPFIYQHYPFRSLPLEVAWMRN